MAAREERTIERVEERQEHEHCLIAVLNVEAMTVMSCLVTMS